mmetsp:Transcript_34930/g.88215  ORF Transcript_34930/g.88215 Transcript_34930/m.88215 type:complete len:417 (-) Transcript_34930:161-1411(-)
MVGWAGGMKAFLCVSAVVCTSGFSHSPAAGLRGMGMQLRGVESAPRGGVAQSLKSLREEGGWKGLASGVSETHTAYVQDFRARLEGAAARLMEPEEPDTLVSLATATAGMNGPERWAEVVKFAASKRDPEVLEALWNEPKIEVNDETGPGEKATAAVAIMAVLSGCEHSIAMALSPEILSVYMAQSAEFVAQGWAAYNAALVAGGSVGVIAKGVTSSTIMGVGDIIGQKLFPTPEAPTEEEEGGKEGLQALLGALPFARAAEERPLEDAAMASFDPKRTSDFALVGAIIATPIDAWYAFLGKVDFASLLPGVPALAGKVLLDQLMWAPFCLASVFGLLSGLQGDGVAGWKEKMRTTWGKTVLSNWVLWVPAQMVNFLIIPPQLQLLYANMVGLGWNVYLSKVSQGGEDAEACREGA